MWNEVFRTLDNQLANDHSVASHPPTEDRPFIIAPFSGQRPPAGDPTVGAHRQDTTQLEAQQQPTPLLSKSSPTRISRPRTQDQATRTQPYRLDVRHGSTPAPRRAQREQVSRVARWATLPKSTARRPTAPGPTSRRRFSAGRRPITRGVSSGPDPTARWGSTGR